MEAPEAPAFALEQVRDDGGGLRLSLIGELDVLTSAVLAERLASLKAQGASVLVDLSRLTFADSSGLRTLVHAAEDASRDGWSLHIGTDLRPPVRRLIDLVEAGPLLWGRDEPASD